MRGNLVWGTYVRMYTFVPSKAAWSYKGVVFHEGGLSKEVLLYFCMQADVCADVYFCELLLMCRLAYPNMWIHMWTCTHAHTHPQPHTQREVERGREGGRE